MGQSIVIIYYDDSRHVLILNKYLLLQLESGDVHGQMNTWAINLEILELSFLKLSTRQLFLKIYYYYFNYGQNGKGTMLIKFYLIVVMGSWDQTIGLQ